MSTATQNGTQTQPTAADQADVIGPEAATPRRRVHPLVLGIVALVLIAIGTGYYLYSSSYEETDDAQVDGHLNPIAARIDGTISVVHVDDNQIVRAGEPLRRTS